MTLQFAEPVQQSILVGRLLVVDHQLAKVSLARNVAGCSHIRRSTDLLMPRLSLSKPALCIQSDSKLILNRYEKFMLQTFLSKDPNFRWCLSPLCETGQLYQQPPRNSKTSCEECNFEMCFKHQMPWHEGLTCDEYDNQRDHGDPNYGETQEWIRTNTKPCPGCQVGIQKGEACFHMTCKSLSPTCPSSR